MSKATAATAVNGRQGAAGLGEFKDPGLNGTTQVELAALLHAMQAMRAGDFSVRMGGDHTGIVGKIADSFNECRYRMLSKNGTRM